MKLFCVLAAVVGVCATHPHQKKHQNATLKKSKRRINAAEANAFMSDESGIFGVDCSSKKSFGAYYGCKEWAREWNSEVVGDEKRSDWTYKESMKRMEEGLKCDTGAHKRGSSCSGDCGGCAWCTAGKYRGSPNKQTTCKGCQAGSYSTARAKKCDSCEAGKFSNDNAGSCTGCPTGFDSGAGQPGCVDVDECANLKCDDGQSCSNSVGSYECLDCEAGKYAQGSNPSSCTVCGAGKYSGNGKATSCAICGAGKFSAAGASSCTDCPVGRYSDADSESCTLCTHGEYQDLAGQASCKPIPGDKAASAIAF